MKLTATTKSLMNALNVAGKVVGKKNTMAILDDFMFWQSETGDWYVTAGSTDLQVTLLTPLTLTSGEPERFCVNATSLTQKLSLLADAPMEMEVKDKMLHIKVGKGKYKLPYEEAVDYPTLQQIQGEVKVGISGSALTLAVKRGMAARSEDELRPQMSGVAMDTQDGKVTFVASDGNQLFRYDAEATVEGEKQMIIMPSGMAGIVETAFKTADLVQIEANANSIMMWSYGVSIVGRKVEGRYPNYKSVIPDVSQGNKVVVNTKELIQVVTRCKAFASDATSLVAMTFNGMFMEVSGEDIDFSEGATEEVGTVKSEAKPGMRIGVHAGKFLNLLKNLQSENVQLCVTEPSRPIIILEDADEPQMLQLLMPMLLNN